MDPLLSRRPIPVCQARAACTNHQTSGSMLTYPSGPFLVPCCLRYTVAQWLMLLRATASNIISMLTTPNYVLPCTPPTHPTDWPFSLSVPLTSCSAWYLQNGLQLNPDKSEAMIISTANQLHAASSAVSSVSTAGVDLPVGLADEMKVLGIVLSRLISVYCRKSVRTNLVIVIRP